MFTSMQIAILFNINNGNYSALKILNKENYLKFTEDAGILVARGFIDSSFKLTEKGIKLINQGIINED